MRQIQRDTDGTLLVGHSTAALTMRRAFIQCLRQRRPQALFIDEGQHLLKIGTGRLIDQMDNLKWIMDESQTPLILVGTYELLHLCGLNGNWRRSVRVEFPATGWIASRSSGRFKMCSGPFSTMCRWRRGRISSGRRPSITCGRWAVLACSRTLLPVPWRRRWRARRAPSRRILVEEHVDWPALEQMAREIHEGEAQVAARPPGGAEERVGTLLGLPAAGRPTPDPRGVRDGAPPAAERPPRRVGERRLGRDRCGEGTP